jgi:hypothetical protein
MSYKKIETMYVFRGIRKDTKETIEGSLVEINDRVFINKLYKVDNPRSIKFRDVFTEVYWGSIREFTNMVDSEGTILFDGDICRNIITRNIVEIKRVRKQLMIVEPHENDCSVRFTLNIFRAQKLERVGSIYDEPNEQWHNDNPARS